MPLRAQRLEHRRDFEREHRDVAGDHRVGVRAGEGGPGVQAHARVDLRAVLAQVDVGPADRDLVDRPVLLALVADDLRERGGVDGAGARGAGAARGGGSRLRSISARAGFSRVREIRGVPMPCTCM